MEREVAFNITMTVGGQTVATMKKVVKVPIDTQLNEHNVRGMFVTTAQMNPSKVAIRSDVEVDVEVPLR